MFYFSLISAYEKSAADDFNNIQANILKIWKNKRKSLQGVENIFAIEGTAHYEQFQFLPKLFKNRLLQKHQKSSIHGKGLNQIQIIRNNRDNYYRKINRKC